MKKIYYLLAAITITIAACQKQPNAIPASYVKKNVNFTLQQTDYQLLPSSDYPYYSYSFDNNADANTYIPIILNARDPQLGNGSTANITFAIGAPYIKVPDTLYSHLTYTLTPADYVAGGSNYGDFTSSDIINWLSIKYPNPSRDQLAIITYVLYTGSDNTVTNSFFYRNGAWIKIYQVSPAQYAAVGDGTYDNFSSAEQGKLAGYFNAFLKADISIMDTIKTNDVEYVSYQIYEGKTYQTVLGLVYDGNNFGVFNHNATLAYIKTNGNWVPNQAIYYTLTSNDTQLIAASNIGTASQRTNLGQYGDFSGWSAADLNSAMILVLTHDFPNPKVGVNYVVTYLNYTGGSDIPTQLAFQYNGTTWAPAQL